MIKTSKARVVPIALLTLALGSLSPANAMEGYTTSSDGSIVHNSTGLCWHSSDWSMDKAVLGCDGIADSDGDGVYDSKDQCPDTPKGTEVDDVGCPLDSDGDGVIDAKDQCPDTPKGTKVDSVGCPMDSDGDGVNDSKDQCPNTPRGTKVDSVGCPMDSDGDGVVDSMDRCPGTPAGTKVDKVGCPLKATIELHGINFALNKAAITGGATQTLDDMVETLKRYPELRVEIAGHTDSTGAEAYNQALSERRAAAVKSYMVERGIDARRLTTTGYGESRPVASNATREGRARNRRVELNIIDR